eukprot:3127217-Amphidinium_carterae.1
MITHHHHHHHYHHHHHHHNFAGALRFWSACMPLRELVSATASINFATGQLQVVSKSAIAPDTHCKQITV